MFNYCDVDYWEFCVLKILLNDKRLCLCSVQITFRLTLEIDKNQYVLYNTKLSIIFIIYNLYNVRFNINTLNIPKKTKIFFLIKKSDNVYKQYIFF